MSYTPIHVSESILSGVIDNLTAAIILVNNDRRVVLSNKMTEAIAGQPRAALAGKRGGEVLGCVNSVNDLGGCGFDPQCALCEVKKKVELTFQKKDECHAFPADMTIQGAGVRHLRISTKYLILDSLETVLISLEDITEIRQKEKILLENVQLKAAMATAGAVCHEINNPLMIISGYLQLLLSEIKEDDLRHDYLMQMNAGLERIQKVTLKLMGINVFQTQDYGNGGRILDIEGASSQTGGGRPAQVRTN